MAYVRLSPESANQVHRVYDAMGNLLQGCANKATASRWINTQKKLGADTTGWTMRAVVNGQEVVK